MDKSGSGQEPEAGSCEHGNETSGYMKGKELFDQPSDHQLLEKDFALWRLVLIVCRNYAKEIYISHGMLTNTAI